MRETKFIEQNREKWEDFERELKKGNRPNVEKLNRLFIQITDDLSYSRTFYPNRSVRVYLNGLAQQIFSRIYKNTRSGGKNFRRFWSEELPLLVYDARSDFRLSFLVFTLALLVGALSSRMDPEFPAIIMGDAYVEMTQANIESGDPMKVYKSKGEFQMFLGITLNNMLVALRTFLMGALFLIGTLVILVHNGIMVGAFQYFFMEQGLLRESFLTIWMHGALEISAIVIAGAAGLTMGRGLAFPGTYSRLQAFQRSGRRGLKILLGTLPLFLVAGFIEGYFTRHTEAPDLLRATCIALSFLFVLFYFVFYPIYRGRRDDSRAFRESSLQPDAQKGIEFGQILSSGEVFSKLFVVFRGRLGYLIRICLLMAAAFSTFAFLSSRNLPSGTFYYPSEVFGTLRYIVQFFRLEAAPFLPLANGVFFTILLASTHHLLLSQAHPGRFTGSFPHIRSLLVVSVPAFALSALLFFSPTLSLLGFVIGFPPIMLWAFTAQIDGNNPIRSLGNSISLLFVSPSRIVGIFLIILLFGFTLFNLVDSPLIRGYINLLSWVVALSQERMNELATIWLTFVYVFMLYLILVAFALSFGLTYFSLLEIRDCPNLRKKIEAIGLKKTIRGMETEE
jgi:uncharacterized membrane protein SpoIIM required for sporulation